MCRIDLLSIQPMRIVRCNVVGAERAFRASYLYRRYRKDNCLAHVEVSGLDELEGALRGKCDADRDNLEAEV